MLLCFSTTTTETYNSPGWKLVFIPVFQPGLCSRDKCTPSFYPDNYGTGINNIFHKQKTSAPSAHASSSRHARLFLQFQMFLHNCNNKINYKCFSIIAIAKSITITQNHSQAHKNPSPYTNLEKKVKKNLKTSLVRRAAGRRGSPGRTARRGHAEPPLAGPGCAAHAGA